MRSAVIVRDKEGKYHTHTATTWSAAGPAGACSGVLAVRLLFFIPAWAWPSATGMGALWARSQVRLDKAFQTRSPPRPAAACTSALFLMVDNVTPDKASRR